MVKLQTSACNFTKSKTPPLVFLTLFKLYKWWQIAQSVSYTDDTEYWKALKEVLVHGRETSHKLTQKQSPEVFFTKAVLKTFTIFTGKHLCWIFFLIKLQAKACWFIKNESITGVFL